MNRPRLINALMALSLTLTVVAAALAGSDALATTPSPAAGPRLATGPQAEQPRAATAKPPVGDKDKPLEHKKRPPAAVRHGPPLVVAPLVVAPVVVTSRRPDAALLNIPVGVTIINRKRLEALMPRTTAEALRNQPGVWIQRTGHTGGSPIIRGFMGNRVLYLFDGIRRNTASIFGGPNGYLNTTDQASVQRIEVIRGPGAVLYGSDAIGGIINVISAHPIRFSKRGARLGGLMRSWYGTVDGESTTSVEASASTRDLMLNLGGSYQQIGNVTGGGDAGVLKPTSSSYRAMDAQVALRLSSRDAIEVLAQYFRRPDETRYDRPDRKRDSARQMVVLRYHGKQRGFTERSFAELYMHRQTAFTTKSSSISDSRELTWGGELRATSAWQRLQLTYGVHLHHDHIEVTDPKKRKADPKVDFTNAAAFALATYKATSRLSFEGGARLDYLVLTSTAPPANSVPQGLEASDLAVSRADLAPTGGLGAIYRLTDTLRWTANAGTAFRAPGKSDFLRAGEFSFGYVVPPPVTPKPERSFTLETGLRSNHRRAQVSLNVFYTTVRDIITSKRTQFKGSDYVDYDHDGRTGAAEDNDGDKQTSADEEVYAKSNAGNAQAYGVELAFKVRTPRGTSVYGNATWMRGDQSHGEPLDRAIPANGTLGLRWASARLKPDYWLEFAAHGAASFSRLRSSRTKRDPAYKVDPQNKKSASILVNGALPGFLVFGARAGARIMRRVTLTLALDNLTDQRYRVKDSRIDAPGFSARLGVSARF